MSARLFTLVGLLFLLALPAVASPTDQIEWHKDFKKAQELAKKTGKPMLLDFAASWCKPCKEMEKTIWPQPQVIEAAKQFVAVSLDFDRRGPENSRYRVASIPCVVVTDPWGNLLAVQFGYSPNMATKLIQILQSVPTDFSTVSEWNSVLEKENDSSPALVGLAEFYRRYGVPDLSNSYFKRALKAKETIADRNRLGTILIAMGINYLQLKDYDEARKSFESYLKEIPNGDQGDNALLGILVVHVNRRKIGEAEKALAQLKASYPKSPMVKQAEQLVQQASSLKN